MANSSSSIPFRRLARSFAVAALLAAAFLISPLSASAADGGRKMKGETVEQRIDQLHKALKITPDEEADWANVAQTMRDNAAAMEKLVADKAATSPDSTTAIEDLKSYQTFAQTHVNGLKNLISSFEILYDKMPDAQKKVADKVFDDFGRGRDKRQH